MPEGMEAHLRETWKALHGYNMLGTWLLHEDVMSKLYYKLNEKPKSLYVPDLAALCRKSDLSQKPAKGTLITEDGSVERVEFHLDPCTNHPDFWLRIRAYIMTICWLVCDTPNGSPSRVL